MYIDTYHLIKKGQQSVIFYTLCIICIRTRYYISLTNVYKLFFDNHEIWLKSCRRLPYWQNVESARKVRQQYLSVKPLSLEVSGLVQNVHTRLFINWINWTFLLLNARRL